MDDYIKRSDAINAIESLPTWWADEGGYYGGMQQPRVALLEPEDVINAIKKIPSADVAEVKHGTWLAIGNTGLASCKCGYITDRYSIYNYCPNCGADMRGGT